MASPFIIMFLARSGSTALYGHLRRHPDIRMRAEVFGARSLPDGSEQTDENRIRFLQKFWAPFASDRVRRGVRWRGFKWQIDRKNTQFSEPHRLIKVMQKYRPKIIVLKRENILKQAISTLNARRVLELTASSASPSAHVTTENAAVIECLRATKLKVDVSHLHQIVAGIRDSERQLDALATEIPCFETVRYEDYVKDEQRVVARLFTFIGVDPTKHQGGVYVKITPDDLSLVVENYDELCRFAREHDLESML